MAIITDNLDILISRLASIYGSPSISLERLKEEVDPRKVEFSKQARDEILEINQCDLDLFEYVKSQQEIFFK